MNTVKHQKIPYRGMLIVLLNDADGSWDWYVIAGPGNPNGACSEPGSFPCARGARTRCLATAKQHIDSRLYQT